MNIIHSNFERPFIHDEQFDDIRTLDLRTYEMQSRDRVCGPDLWAESVPPFDADLTELMED